MMCKSDNRNLIAAIKSTMRELQNVTFVWGLSISKITHSGPAAADSNRCRLIIRKTPTGVDV